MWKWKKENDDGGGMCVCGDGDDVGDQPIYNNNIFYWFDCFFILTFFVSFCF